MSLRLEHVKLPLGRFDLRLDITCAAPVTAVFGPSGAGKTSLLELIAGLRAPSEGRVSLAGEPLDDVGHRVHVHPERRGIGYVPQEGALFPHLSVRQNLEFGRKVAAGRRSPGFDAIATVLALQPLLSRGVSQLSGGERQRVALGRALLSAPRLLLLDEPLAGLDGPLRQRLVSYLAQIRDQFAVPMLYVTHAADEVMALADEVVLLREGAVRAQARPEVLFTRSELPTWELKLPDAGQGD